MSRILTQDELNDVKTLAESFGFNSVIYDDHSFAGFSKSFKYPSNVQISYDVGKKGDRAFVSVYWDSKAVNIEEFEQFIEVMNQAQKIAKELTKE